MDFISTRNKNLRKNFSHAILSGLAEDGGLFVPESFPHINLSEFDPELAYPVFAEKILKLFIGDELSGELLDLCKRAFNFPVHLKKIDNNNHHTYLLELFHGPTSSFKDFGARFLAECINRLFKQNKTTIMVATSGDTGSAVASAFYEKLNTHIIILYPKGQVSARQEHQMTCWDKNVLTLAVDGNFDHCQALVKSAFQDPWFKTHLKLSSANSINIGRLLPQIIYYAYSSIQFYTKNNIKPGYIIPTGNLGNATAAYWAKAMGFPLREIVLASNANKVIEDYLATGEYKSRPSISTLANAMDVGNPSNFERLSYLYPEFTDFKKQVKAISVDDSHIKETIVEVYKKYKIIICPHTATAFYARQQLDDKPWVVVATADPSKFEEIIEPIIQTKIPIAPQLQALLDRPSHVVPVVCSLEEIQKICVFHT
jgi:threonine synthase